MTCYKPLTGFMAREPNPNGKRQIVFSMQKGFYDIPVTVPCGQCIGCRVDRSKMWALRCVHEASLYSRNCFITLTFDDRNIANDGSLNGADFQKFMKRLRKRFPSEKIRFFHCGEYGSQLFRPHHHACIFGFDFPDRVFWSDRNGVKLYRSRILEELWPFGFCTIGDVTFESAAYVARYVTKKITGEKADSHYQGRKPEFVTMSRRPGIGKGWLDKFGEDILRASGVVTRSGAVKKPPRYYDDYLLTNLSDYDKYILARRKEGLSRKNDNVPKRLKVKKYLFEKKVEQLKRGLE